MKVCYKCKVAKPSECFSKRSKGSKDGLKGTCKECRNSEYSEYHKRCPEVSSRRIKRWLQNPENRKKSNKYAATRYWKDPIKSREMSNARKKTEKGKLRVARYNNARRDKTRLQVNTLTLSEISLLLDVQNGKCAKCGVAFDEEVRYTLDHILPLSMGGNLTLHNVQLLCRPCNASKSKNFILYRLPLPNEIW